MTVEFLEEAEQELAEAALWYEAKELGLGSRMRDEVAPLSAGLPKTRFCGESEKAVTAESIVRYFRISSHTSFADRKLL